MMDHFKDIFRKKPLFFLFISLAYLVAVGLFKWKLTPPAIAFFYLMGGFVGVYFLDGAEAFFRLKPSPFRSVVFMALFSVVSFFIVTSSGSLFATGLVLSLYLSLLLWQVGEWRVMGSLHSWYRMVAGPVSVSTQKFIMVSFIAIFLVETYLFTR